MQHFIQTPLGLGIQRLDKPKALERGRPVLCTLSKAQNTLADNKPTVCPSNDSASMLSYQELPTSIQLWRGHGQEAKIGSAGGHRITRNLKRLGRFSSRVRPPGCPCSRCGT